MTSTLIVSSPTLNGQSKTEEIPGERIVKTTPKWLHTGVFPRRMNAIREKRHDDLVHRIDPKRSSRETEMPDGASRENFS